MKLNKKFARIFARKTQTNGLESYKIIYVDEAEMLQDIVDTMNVVFVKRVDFGLIHEAIHRSIIANGQINVGYIRHTYNTLIATTYSQPISEMETAKILKYIKEFN